MNMGNIEQSVLPIFLIFAKMKNILIIIALIALAGCGKETRQSGESLVVIDGEAISSVDLCDSMCFLLRTEQMAGRKKQPNSLAKYVNDLAKRVLPSLVANKLLNKYFLQVGITPSESSSEIVLDKYRRKCRAKKATFDELYAQYGDSGDYFKRQFEFECKLQTAQERFSTESVTDEMVAKKVLTANRRRNAFKRFNDASSNKVYQAWGMLKNGANWSEVAKTYSDDKEVYGDDCKFDEYWEDIVDKLDFYIPEVGKAVSGLSAGQFTDPIMADEGYIIARVNECEGNIRKCSRILTRLFIVDEEMTAESARKALVNEQLTEFNRKIIAQMKECSKIEYPMGTNIEYDVWSQISNKFSTNAGKR